MPEIPDLEAYATYFNRRLPGLSVAEVEAPIGWIVRTGSDKFAEKMPGQVFKPVYRHAKLLMFPFESLRVADLTDVVVNHEPYEIYRNLSHFTLADQVLESHDVASFGKFVFIDCDNITIRNIRWTEGLRLLTQVKGQPWVIQPRCHGRPRQRRCGPISPSCRSTRPARRAPGGPSWWRGSWRPSRSRRASDQWRCRPTRSSLQVCLTGTGPKGSQ